LRSRPQFEALTGVTVRFEKVPPGQIRQKSILDFTSKTGTYATSATDPMYYPLYVANKWVEPLDRYLGDTSLTGSRLVQLQRPPQGVARRRFGRRQAVRHSRTTAKSPVQVYRKDLYDAKGLKPAETLDDLLKNAQAVHAPNDRVWGLALRGFRRRRARTCTSIPSIFRSFGGDWFQGGRIRVNGPEADRRARLVRERALEVCAARGAQLELARHRGRVLAGNARRLRRCALVRSGTQQSGEIEGHRQDRLRALAGRSHRKARDLDLELGLPDQRVAVREGQAGDLALHLVGCRGRDPGAHVVEVCRTGEALRREPLFGLAQPEFTAFMRQGGHNFVEAALASLDQDTDVNWRPRVPQWPAIGDTMATAIQATLVGQRKSKEALDEAQGPRSTRS
jgi:multiple sugar transport system substrate-binding protein